MNPVGSRRRFLASVGSVGAVGLAGCTAGSSEDGDEDVPPADATVRMTDDFSFDPEVVRIDVGETVVWENTSQARQSVTAYEDEIPAQSEYFASSGAGRELMARIQYPYVGGLNTSDRYRNTFEMAGTYEYFSIPWEDRGMIGTVVVSE